MNTVSLFRYQERMYALSQAAQGAELMRAGWELVWTFDPDIGETVRAEAEKELAKLERRIDRMIDRAAPQVVV